MKLYTLVLLGTLAALADGKSLHNLCNYFPKKKSESDALCLLILHSGNDVCQIAVDMSRTLIRLVSGHLVTCYRCFQ